MIKSTSGAELCATHLSPNPKPSDCVRAYDATYDGQIDLSRKVVVGEPVRKSSTRWSVPYNVKDEAGNEAATVYRDIVVEEVGLDDLQAKIHAEYAEREKQLLATIDNLQKSPRNRRTTSCPTCPKCDCSSHLNEQSCRAFCGSFQGTCSSPPPQTRQMWLTDVIDPWEFASQSVVPVAVAVLAILFLIAACRSNGKIDSQQMYDSRPYGQGPASMHMNGSSSAGRPPLGYSSPPLYAATTYRTDSTVSASTPRRQSSGADLFTPPNSIYKSRHSISGSPNGDGVRTR